MVIIYIVIAVAILIWFLGMLSIILPYKYGKYLDDTIKGLQDAWNEKNINLLLKHIPRTLIILIFSIIVFVLYFGFLTRI
jgi:hypothetical protein